MNGQEIFERYQKDRDFSGSPSDEYAQLLSTLHFQLLTEEFYSILEKAESENKKIELKEESLLNDEYTLSDLILA